MVKVSIERMLPMGEKRCPFFVDFEIDELLPAAVMLATYLFNYIDTELKNGDWNEDEPGKFFIKVLL